MEGVHKIWKRPDIIRLRFCFSSMILLVSTRFLGRQSPLIHLNLFKQKKLSDISLNLVTDCMYSLSTANIL